MIKIYDKKEVQVISPNSSISPVVDVVYNFTEDENNLFATLVITYEDRYEDRYESSFNVTIDKKLFSDKILTIALLGRDSYGRFKDIVFDPKYHQVYGFYSRGTDSNLFNAASIWIPSDNTPITIVTHIRTNDHTSEINNSEYNVIDFVDNDPQTTLLSLVPEALAAKNRWFLKKKYIQNLLDPYESIAYLEGQVDVLSKIIGILIEKTGVDVGDYKTILQDIDKNNVIDVKTLDKIRSELSEDKAKVRNIQKAYYIAKNG